LWKWIISLTPDHMRHVVCPFRFFVCNFMCVCVLLDMRMRRQTAGFSYTVKSY
jgi:hypothetical protein